METKKLYFRTIEDTNCETLESIIADAKSDGLTEVKAIEAIPDNDNSEYIFCGLEGAVGERSECTKYNCEGYSKKGGRGVCEHRGNLYQYGEEFTFKVH